MQTNFAPDQLSDPQMAASEKILRTCVHCGFCTATCPTYQVLGDELDSPRGRIYLIKDMLENNRPADEKTVKHIDRCLSCLACMTTCPSGVHYMHLVDHARAHIEKTYDRPFLDKAFRTILSTILPYPARFRFALLGAAAARPLAPLFAKIPVIGARMAAMLRLAPSKFAGRTTMPGPGVYPTATNAPPRARVALLTGCAQPVLKPEINEATIRLLTRLGVEVVLPRGEGCCGALVHHMGNEHASHHQAAANVDAWWRETHEGGGKGLDAILITASGCGTTIKDYGFMMRTDPAYADKAAKVSALAKDITEFLASLNLPAPAMKPNLTVAYHSACSMQHGQQIKTQPLQLLRDAGFRVREVPEGHLCCGSAGVYNILQPEIARELRDRKIANIERLRPDLIATGNIGCITQIGSATGIPIVHTVELLDWVHGGPAPAVLEGPVIPIGPAVAAE
jgi:glycolate oxidase iron-sulfur subunit